MAKISVIIPVYNVEKYIGNCLLSLENQSIFDDLEIILVDDGSIDSSFSYCNGFHQKYPNNVVVIRQSNKGVSAARNIGLNRATGEYITFLDADDTIEYDTYEFLLENIKKHQVDMVLTDLTFVYSNGKYKKKRKEMVKKYHSNKEIMKAFLSGEVLSVNIVDKLFKKDIIGKVRFMENYSVGEDMYFLYQVLRNVNTIFVDTTVSKYNYFIRANSAMTSTFTDKYLDTVKLSEKILSDYNSEEELAKYAEAHLIHEICKVLEYMILNSANEKYHSVKKKYLKSIRRYSLISAYKYLSKRQFLGIILMKISPELYIKIFKLMQNM